MSTCILSAATRFRQLIAYASCEASIPYRTAPKDLAIN